MVIRFVYAVIVGVTAPFFVICVLDSSRPEAAGASKAASATHF